MPLLPFTFGGLRRTRDSAAYREALLHPDLLDEPATAQPSLRERARVAWRRAQRFFTCLLPRARDVVPESDLSGADEVALATWFTRASSRGVAHRRRGCLGANYPHQGSALQIAACCSACCPAGFTVLTRNWPGQVTHAYLLVRGTRWGQLLGVTKASARGASPVGGFVGYDGFAEASTRRALEQWVHAQLQHRAAVSVCGSIPEEPALYAVLDARSLASDVVALWVCNVDAEALTSCARSEIGSGAYMAHFIERRDARDTLAFYASLLEEIHGAHRSIL